MPQRRNGTVDRAREFIIRGSRIYFFLLCKLVLAGLISWAPHAAGGEATAQVQKEQNSMDRSSLLLVKFKDNISEADRLDVHAGLGVTLKDKLLHGDLHVVEVPYPDSLEAIQRAYQATPGVEYVEKEMRVSIPEPIEDSSGEDMPRSGLPNDGVPSIDSHSIEN
jgi:hypothetical protein